MKVVAPGMNDRNPVVTRAKDWSVAPLAISDNLEYRLRNTACPIKEIHMAATLNIPKIEQL